MYIGIDLGTSAIKVILMDDEENIIAQAKVPLQVTHPQNLWSEQNPKHWWQALDSAMYQLKKQARTAMAKVRTIGLAGQMHGITLLDKQGKILRPAILWNDGRAKVECDELLQAVPDALDISANLIMPGFSAAKLLWVKKHEPQIFNKIDKILLPKDYLRYRLSGDFATDLSDASGTSWLNVKERQWSDKLLNACDLTQAHVPKLFEGNAITGTISKKLANTWGLPNDTKIIAGAGDNAASAISVNVTQSGQAFLSIGTSGVYFVADQYYRPNPNAAVHTMCHCIPNTWHEMTVHLSAASSLRWLANTLGEKDISKLIELAKTQASDDPPIFLPYLSGERSPHNDPYARGVFFGMTHRTQNADLVQAVLEGTAFAFAQGQQSLFDAKVEIDAINVVGGGARSHYWGEILSAALNQTLTYRQAAEVGASFGAARLAWLADKKAAPNELKLAPIQDIIEPNKNRVKRYQARLELFGQLYQQLKPVFNNAYNL